MSEKNRKAKHNKRRNTGLIYYTTIRKITEAACGDNKGLSQKLTKTLVRALSRNPIKTELGIYQAIINEYSSPTLGSKEAIGKFIDGLLSVYKKTDASILEQQRARLIREVNKIVPIEDVLATKINNLTYKLLASTFVVLKSSAKQTINETKDFVYLYDKLFRMLSEAQSFMGEKKNPELNGVEADKLIVKLMLEKFNQKYRDLSRPQKEIIREYIQYIFNEETYKEFPLKLHSIIETACRAASTYKYSLTECDLKEKVKTVIERTKNKEEWPLHKLVTEALEYVELNDTLRRGDNE